MVKNYFLNHFFYKYKKSCYLILFFAIFLVQNSFFYSISLDVETLPSLEPAFLLDFGENATLAPEQIITASLKFSSCQENTTEWNNSMQVFNELCQQVSTKNFMSLPEEERAEAVLSLLYKSVLTKYSEKETSMQVALSKGIYNCVSSSLLYMALAKKAKIEVFGQKTLNHAFCSVLINGKMIDVETTNPYGFNPGTKKDSGFDDGSYTIVPKHYYSGRQQVSDRVFVSLIAANFNSIQLKTGDYKTAVPLAAARYVFVGNENSPAAKLVRQEFDIVCTNYLLDLMESNQENLALHWAYLAISRWGITAFWQSNLDSSVYNAIVRKLNIGNLEDAQNFFSFWQNYLSEKNKNTLAQHIFISTLDWKTQNMTPEEALAFLNDAENNPLASQQNISNKIRSLKEYYWQLKIMPLADKQKYLEAGILAQKALEDIGKSSSIARFKEQCFNNHGILIHNQFATLVNQGKYDEAYSLLEQGLKDLPNNSLLISDMNKLKKMMN